MSSSVIKFHKGDMVFLHEQPHRVISQDSTGTFMQSSQGGSVFKTHAEMVASYIAREMRYTRCVIDALPDGIKNNLGRVLDEFSEVQRTEALFRHECMIMAEKFITKKRISRRPAGFGRVGRFVCRLARKRTAKETGKSILEIPLRKVSGSTVRNWFRRWVASGRQVASLVPLHDLKGCTDVQIDPEVEDIVRERIRDTYLTLEQPPLSVVIEMIYGDIDQRNLLRTTALDYPSETTIRRFVKRNVSEFELVYQREGKKAAEQRFRNVRPHLVLKVPMGVVEMDHTRLDTFSMREPKGPMNDRRRKHTETVRLWLTTAICVATRVLVGWHISTEPPSWSSVMACLQHMCMPKDHLAYGASTPHPAFGFPKMLVLDNGKEFHSNSLKAAAAHGDFEVRFCPRGKPKSKPFVERMNGNIARDFLATTPGRTFSNVQERGDYPAEKRAAYYVEEMRKRFGRWVHDIYHNRPHSGLWGKNPLQQWEELKGFGVNIPPSFDELRAITGLVLPRKVTATGVQFLGLKYQSDELQAVHKKKGHVGKEYTVKADPNDMSHILVLDDTSSKWIEVECIYPDLVEDTTLAEWKEIVALSKAKIREGQKVALKVLRATRREMQEEDRRRGNRRSPMLQTELEALQRETEDFDVTSEDSVIGQTALDLHAKKRHARRRAKSAATHQESQLRQIGQSTFSPEPANDDAHVGSKSAAVQNPANDDFAPQYLNERKVAENDHD